MNIIQIILVLFAAFGFMAAISRYRRGGLSLYQIALWTLLWLGVAGVAARPEIATLVARRLGVGRGADVVVYLSLAAVFYLLFRMLARVEDQERQITRLARAFALKDVEKREHV